ncbi:hypothetical protein ACROYT_G033564 [Oculina patagonica]
MNQKKSFAKDVARCDLEGVKAQKQRPHISFIGLLNYFRIMTVSFLLVLLMCNKSNSALAMQECGSVVNNTLISPGYPIAYPNNLDCNYSVPIPHGMAMKIYFHELNVEYHPTCK